MFAVQPSAAKMAAQTAEHAGHAVAEAVGLGEDDAVDEEVMDDVDETEGVSEPVAASEADDDDDAVVLTEALAATLAVREAEALTEAVGEGLQGTAQSPVAPKRQLHGCAQPTAPHL